MIWSEGGRGSVGQFFLGRIFFFQCQVVQDVFYLLHIFHFRYSLSASSFFWFSFRENFFGNCVGPFPISKNVMVYIWLVTQHFSFSICCLDPGVSKKSLAFLCVIEIPFSFSVISGSYCSSTSGSHAVF